MMRRIAERFAQRRTAIGAARPGGVNLLSAGGTFRRPQTHPAAGAEGVSLLQGKTAVRTFDIGSGRGCDRRVSRLGSVLMFPVIHRCVHKHTTAHENLLTRFVRNAGRLSSPPA